MEHTPVKSSRLSKTRRSPNAILLTRSAAHSQRGTREKFRPSGGSRSGRESSTDKSESQSKTACLCTFYSSSNQSRAKCLRYVFPILESHQPQVQMPDDSDTRELQSSPRSPGYPIRGEQPKLSQVHRVREGHEFTLLLKTILGFTP
jgi:hypothetical protein